MQSDHQEIRLGKNAFQVYMLPPRQARRIFVEMTKVFGPSLGSILGDVVGGKKVGSIMDMKIEELGIDLSEVAASFVDRLDDERIEKMMDDLAAVTTVDGGAKLSDTFDVIFRGRFTDMLKWFLFALKANFGNFIEGFETLLLGPDGAQDQETTE